MKTEPLQPHSLTSRILLLVGLVASIVGCGHVLTVQLFGRSGDACNLARPFACDVDREHLLECRPQYVIDQEEALGELPGVWEVRCPCVAGCLVEMVSESDGFDPVDVATEIDCSCADEA